MKISDWNIAGQLWSALTEAQNYCREQCRLLNVGPQIIVWLNTPRGKEALSKAVASVATAWKVEHAQETRCNRIMIKPESFEYLVRSCFFEGRNANASSYAFPSNVSIGETIEFMEIATDVPLEAGKESELFLSHGLRQAVPLEFLAWLKANVEAGILTSIHCAVPNITGEYMYCAACGRGGRGLHIDRPVYGMWPPATVFLGVKSS